MKPETVAQLQRLNLQFYQTFAGHFSATRQRIQPGVMKILRDIDPEHRILDIGCGNGNLWQALLRNSHLGAYVGLDFSPELIRIAASSAEQNRSRDDKIPNPVFITADLSGEDWTRKIPDIAYDWVFLLAVLHHSPGHESRQKILRQIHSLLPEDGRLVLSVWQFRNSEKLARRIQDWSEVGLTQSDVDKNDFLLDWRSGGIGMRYVHLFDDEELRILAEENGFSVEDSYYSDGEGGKLSQYQIWEHRK